VLFISIDGVAPRSKMNQQRSRRFRSAQESLASFNRKQALRQHWVSQYGIQNELIDRFVENRFDSSLITPGTEFMADLAVALRFYIYERSNSHKLWQGLTVLFSDSNVPGEGEHKILEFIRLQRAQTGYSPNVTHCLYGADGDLIMLALSAHEPHFYIIREQMIDFRDNREQLGQSAKRVLSIGFQYGRI